MTVTPADRLATAYRDHAAELHRFALRLTRDLDDADDTVQEALLRALRSDGSFAAAPARAWLMTAVRHVVIDRARRRDTATARWAEVAARTARDLDDCAGLGEFEDRLVERLDAQTAGPALRAALAALSPGRRAAVVAHDVQQRPTPELAAERGVRPATIRGQVFDGRRALRAALGYDR